MCEEGAYLKGECTLQKPNFCLEDEDCACGSLANRECFIGSKGFVNTENCYDYCKNISLNAKIECIKNKCQLKENFCGFSTYGSCNSDEECTPMGCSGQICQSVNENAIITGLGTFSTCEYKDCYDPVPYNLSCKCIEGMCKWSK